jgi:putative ABC transport system substrate-binding protein
VFTLALVFGAMVQAAQAQPVGNVPVVAFVVSTTPVAEMSGPDPIAPAARAFLHGLRDLGWIDGRNVIVERHSAEGRVERGPALFAAIAARRLDVIVSNTGSLVRAAHDATRTIPIVMIGPDPTYAIKAGLIASANKPGGNVTGVAWSPGYELSGKRLQLLREIAPRITRIAFLGSKRRLSMTLRHRPGAFSVAPRGAPPAPVG